MNGVQHGQTVAISYIGTLDNGRIFHSTEDNEPLIFTIGAGQIFPELEQAVIGMRVGEAKNVVLAAEQAYGPRRQENILQLARTAFPADKSISIGQKLSIEFGGTATKIMVVIGVSETDITLDGNHPLAGLELTFALQIRSIQERE